MEALLKQVVESFDSNPVEAARARREMLEMLKQDGPRFSRAVVDLLQSVSDSAGYRYLFRLLLDQGLLYGLLCDPSNFSLEQAVAIARALQKLDPQADTTLARLLLKPATGALEARAADARLEGGFAEERILDIAAAISGGARLLAILVQLLKSPNQKVRSKATLLVGRMTADARAVEMMLTDEDPRTRANAVESLWDVKSPEAEAIFRKAVATGDARTSANGLVGLYRAGRIESLSLILDRVRNTDPQFRASAAWAMGIAGDPRFLVELKRLLSDPDSKVRRHVLTALSGIKRNTDRLGALPPVQVFFTQPPSEPGSARFRAVVIGATGSIAANLAPTNFIVWRGASPVTGFTVSPKPAPEKLTMGIASAIFSRPAHALNPACRSALAACAKLARDTDRWFLAEAKSHPRQPDGLLQAFEGGKLPYTPCDDLWEAGARVLTDITLGSGSRHVILIGAAPAQPDEITTAHLRELALRNNTTLHAVTVGPSPELAALCAHTDGICVTARSNEELPASAAWLYRTLLYHYEIVFSATSDDDEFRLQIFSEEGLGQTEPRRAPASWREPSAAA